MLTTLAHRAVWKLLFKTNTLHIQFFIYATVLHAKVCVFLKNCWTVLCIKFLQPI